MQLCIRMKGEFCILNKSCLKSRSAKMQKVESFDSISFCSSISSRIDTRIYITNQKLMPRKNRSLYERFPLEL